MFSIDKRNVLTKILLYWKLFYRNEQYCLSFCKALEPIPQSTYLSSPEHVLKNNNVYYFSTVTNISMASLFHYWIPNDTKRKTFHESFVPVVYTDCYGYRYVHMHYYGIIFKLFTSFRLAISKTWIPSKNYIYINLGQFTYFWKTSNDSRALGSLLIIIHPAPILSSVGTSWSCPD